MMGVHRVKGLWPRVIRSMGETSLRVSRVETNLDQNQGKGRIFNVTSVGKKWHIKQECLEWKKGNTENIEGSSKFAYVVEEGDSGRGDSDML